MTPTPVKEPQKAQIWVTPRVIGGRSVSHHNLVMQDEKPDRPETTKEPMTTEKIDELE